MKIDYVIVSSDKSWYLDFWPITSKLWKTLLNVTPILALIDEEESEIYEDGNGLVKKFKSVEGVSTGLQSQIVRLYLPKFLDGYCLISDIDMIPLQSEYFISNSLGVNENNFIIYSSDNVECIASSMYPMCYVLSYSKNFDIFHENKNWFDFVSDLSKLMYGWSTDQLFMYEQLNKYNQNKIVKLDRGWPGGCATKRIDRPYWGFGYDETLLKEKYYIDCHLPRPYENYKESIDKLVNLLIQ